MQKTPWFARKRVWIISILLILLYLFFATQVPSPLKMTPRTIGLTDPTFYNGKLDYFAELEKTYKHRLYPKEENGFRTLLIACGPRILEWNAIADAVPWNQLPSYRDGDSCWFTDHWIPTCEQLEMDPYPQPTFLNSLCFEDRFTKLKKIAEQQAQEARQTQPSENASDETSEEWTFEKLDALDDAMPDYKTQNIRDFLEKVIETPRNLKDFPEIADWLEKRSPLLDLYGECVRKPNFIGPRFRAKMGLCDILLPDVLLQRDFAQDLRVRIGDRIANGNIDGAWYDTMSMFTLVRKHYARESFFTVQLVGIGIEGNARDATKLILQHGNPTKEQLEKMAADLDSLPEWDEPWRELEIAKFAIYESLHTMEPTEFTSNAYSRRTLPPIPWDESFLCNLPLDHNIAGEHLAQLYKRMELDKLSRFKYDKKNPDAAKPLLENFNQCFDEIHDKKSDAEIVFALLTIQSRSRLAAEKLVVKHQLPSCMVMLTAYERKAIQFDLLRTVVALERYEREHGAYPENLRPLVPAFLGEVPDDLYAKNTPLVYKRTPDATTPYLLYSVGENGLDDGGTDADMVLRIEK